MQLINGNRHVLMARRTLLKEAGYSVETARDGNEGLESFSETAFDFVVTDFRMPHAARRRRASVAARARDRFAISGGGPLL